MYIEDTRNGRWMIRWQSDGRCREIETAHPLPRNEVSAAKILAAYDRASIRCPQNARLVWLAKSGEELEVHCLCGSNGNHAE